MEVGCAQLYCLRVFFEYKQKEKMRVYCLDWIFCAQTVKGIGPIYCLDRFFDTKQ